MTDNSVYEEHQCFQHPFSCILSGPSQSGKTSFVKSLIKNIDLMISPRISDIILSYSELQPMYQDIINLDERVRLEKGTDFEVSENGNTLIVIDDQMDSAMQDINTQNLFTKGVHHRSISVILITQDLFPEGKYSRTLRRNAVYLVIFRSPTFRSQVQSLGCQMYPYNKSFLASAYTNATERPYTYLFINLHQTCPEELRVRSNIMPDEDSTIYVPVNGR
jgi:hypothetical protein